MHDATFTAPGAGQWELDRSHGLGGATPICQWLLGESCEVAFRRLFREFGVAADTMSMEFVNGFMYTRLRPLFGADKQSTKAPPTLVLKILGRLHPELRRRDRAAARTLDERPWRQAIANWHAELRPQIEACNLAFQDVDLATIDDVALADHLVALLAHCREGFERHFYLHGFDLGPLGLLIYDAKGWGLPTTEVLQALVGASPSTSAPREALARIRREVDAAGASPSTLDELRAVSPAVAAALDDYLRYRGHVLYTRYDIDGLTLVETPEVLLATILHGRADDGTGPDPAAVADSLRERVPAEHRDRFDDLLAEARAAMDLRDDNGPTTVEWPMGLLRLGLLEAGRRLAASGRIQVPDHILELEPGEVDALVRRGEGPGAAALAARAERRRFEMTLDPPMTLGPPQAEPPLDALPENLGRMVAMVQAIIEELGMAERDDASADPLRGVGIGSVAYRGRARVALSPEDAIASLEPGDVLVTRTTSPAFNLVLTLVGGLVTAEGGPMSHAAVLARELGFPAVVGVPGALEAIPDGSLVEVDPSSGRVSVVDLATEEPAPA
ncbi:MAG TPA: PEP-utilizing enzyme [Acidimicrobiales bacterium]|nr:PEP-utilizing enzyme [Acidimicrobiales bacterium]